MVSVYVPGALAPTATAKIEEALLDAGAGLRLAPAGKPVTAKFTIPAKPFVGITVIVYDCVVLPRPAACEPGETDKL